METRTLALCFVTPKSFGYTQNYTILQEQFDYKPVKDLATVTWLNEDPTNVCLATLPG